jgi:hypothetical protein
VGNFQVCVNPSGCGGFVAGDDGIPVDVCDDVHVELITAGLIPASSCLQR